MEISHPPLSCNSCRSHVDGIAYRTTCLHLLCPTCAKNSFAAGHTCVICSTVLSKGEVTEAVIGVSGQVNVADSLFQIAFSKAHLGGIVENLHGMRLAFAELENFVSAQLLFEAGQHQEASIKEFSDNKNLCNQLNSMDSLMRENEDSYKRFRLEVENIAKSKEKEMAELKDAYKEKHRKCQAWEKAYNNIRDQIVAPNGFDTDNRDLKVTAYQKNLVAPFENSNRDHSQISRDQHHELSKSDPAKARIQASSYAHEGNLTYPPTIPTQLASFQSRPVRALRRTEVTTYSKSFAPDAHNDKGHFGMQQRSAARPDVGPTIASAGFRFQSATSGNTPPYYPSSSSQQFEHHSSSRPRINDHNASIAYRQGSSPFPQQHISEQRKRSRSPNEKNSAGPLAGRQRSSFFD